MFKNWKKNALEKMDKSRAGGIDRPIQELVSKINNSDNMFTTSSCSGRIIVFSQGDDDTPGKGHCRWHLTSHEKINPEEFKKCVFNLDEPFSIKFEPCILHICCEDLETARNFCEDARAVGYRNSGISMGKPKKNNKPDKITLAVRHTLGLEVPCPDKSLLSEKYLDFLIDECNKKMEENFRHIEKLTSIF